MKIAPLGDSALLLQVHEQFDEAPEQVLRDVLAVMQRLETAHIPGVVEIAPAYTTVAVFFDVTRVIAAGAPPDDVCDWLAARIKRVPSSANAAGTAMPEPRLVEIPVCYGGDFGLDLNDVAHHIGFAPDEIVRRHSAAEYRVHCLGFMPGFPYLSGMPPELAVPRRATPRKEVPAGSVAIGGAQTGIYPARSPGGWHVIGRTPLRLFSIEGDPPALLRAGDRVRFRTITREEFDAWEK